MQYIFRNTHGNYTSLNNAYAQDKRLKATTIRSTSVDEAIEKIARIKEAHPEDVLQIDVTILGDCLLDS